jgi:chromate transporter
LALPPALEVLAIFTRLGLSCFGGPTAHIGYFREEFVARRRWLDEVMFADLVALCQFLPGPASSQVGFSIGLMRAGFPGAIAAWIGFTLPSAVALVLFAYGGPMLDGRWGAGVLHGLKLVAVAIVANAVWAMARSLCPDRTRAGIGIVAAALILYSQSSSAQIGAILLGGVAGYFLCREDAATSAAAMAMPVSRRAGGLALAAFFLLLVGPPVLQFGTGSGLLALFDAFYRSGALVFGGGHVVLPLLREAIVQPGWVGEDAFLAGYGAAQAVPGPLFTVAAYLGVVATQSVFGAIIGLTGIFLPGLLVLIGALPFWDSFRRLRGAQAAMRGIGAAVVGLLGATLYSPIATSTISNPADIVVALAGFALLTFRRTRPLIVVGFGVAAGLLLVALSG